MRIGSFVFSFHFNVSRSVGLQFVLLYDWNIEYGQFTLGVPFVSVSVFADKDSK